MDNKKFAEFVVDDRKAVVAYNFNSVCDAEDVCGCGLLDAIGRLTASEGQEPLTAKQLRGLLYAMLVEQPWWTKDMREKPAELLTFAGSLIRLDTMEGIIMALVEALTLAASEEIAQQFQDFRKGMQVVNGAPAPQTGDLPIPEAQSTAAQAIQKSRAPTVQSADLRA